MELEEVVKKLRHKADEIETILKDADSMSGCNAAKKYVVDNDLEYCCDEVEAAFKAGFMFHLRQTQNKMLEHDY